MPAERYTFKARTFWCSACDTTVKALLWSYDPVPSCPSCLQPMSQDAAPGKAACVIGDECDTVVEHGICNQDGSPKRFTSKSQMKRQAAELGLRNDVTHIGERGSDKSKHTTRWI